jgi:hypothetical protein
VLKVFRQRTLDIAQHALTNRKRHAAMRTHHKDAIGTIQNVLFQATHRQRTFSRFQSTDMSLTHLRYPSGIVCLAELRSSERRLQ